MTPLFLVAAWSTILDTSDTSVGYADMVAWEGGDVAVIHRAIEAGPNGDEPALVYREWDGGGWSVHTRIDDAMPVYDNKPVENFFELKISRISGDQAVVGAMGRFHGSTVPSTGLEYGVFLRVGRGLSWGDWIVATPIGEVTEFDVLGDDDGIVWFAWDGEGEVHLSSYDTVQQRFGPTLTAGDAYSQPVFHGVNLTRAESGELWLTYNAPDALVAHELVNGTLSPAIPIASPGWPVLHDIAHQDGQLWVVTDEPGVPLYSGSSAGFTTSMPALFRDMQHETMLMMTDCLHSTPELVARPNGTLTVAAARYAFSENFVTGNDHDMSTVVVRTRGPAGWSLPKTAVNDGAWNNVGGAMAASDAGVFIAAADGDRVFVVAK